MHTTPEEYTTGPSMEEEKEKRGGIRIFVGGLGESVGRDDLLKIFSPMGSVEAVDFVRTKGRSFAYIDFCPSSHNSLSKLFSTYNGCVFKGGKLWLEKAKEHYLAKLRREWEERSDDKNTICLPQPPSAASESTHLKIFFPKLGKVKSVPLTGTGKHKYSFQRVEVPSVPKYFCDCEEHSSSHAPQGNRRHDVESHYRGIDEEELNIMNTVMNRLFQANSKRETESSLANIKDNDIEVEEEDEEEKEEEEDQDNLVINVVSSRKTTLPLSRNWDQETVSNKRKSVHNGTQETREGYDQGEKRNRVHPSKLKQSMIHTGSRTEKSTLEIPENNEPSEVDLNKGSRSQKSSWKALLASANNSKFSVSSVLSDIASSKEEQHTLSNSDFVNLPTHENLNPKEADTCSTEGSAAKSTVKNQKSKMKTLRMTRKSVAADTTEGNESTTPTDTNVEAKPVELESSVRYSAIDASFQKLPDEIVLGTDSNPNVSGLVASAKDDQCVPEKSDAEKDVGKETQNLTVKENVDNNLGDGKGPLEAINRSARGSSWRQKSSWTQLVSEKNTSFSITQLFQDLNSQNHGPGGVNHEDAGKSGSNQRERAANQSECKLNEDGFRAVGISEGSIARNSLDGCQPNHSMDASTTATIEERDATMKPPIGSWSGITGDTFRAAGINEGSIARNSSDGCQPNHGIDASTTVATAEPDATNEPRSGARSKTAGTCLFMRCDASLEAWRDAKNALCKRKKRKRHGN